MKRFSEKILENRWNKSGKWHTGAWLESWGKDLKDKRSRFVTRTDQKNAFKDFKRMVKGQMKRYPNMTQKQAMDKIMASEAFTSKEERSNANIAKAARNFGKIVRKDSLIQTSSSTWLIDKGPNAGKTLTIIHDPGSYPSYIIAII